MNRNTPIAVTGIGCLCAAGENLEQCMDSLFAGRQQSAPPTRFSSSHPVRYPVFEIPDEFTLIGTDQKSEVLRTFFCPADAWHSLP